MRRRIAMLWGGCALVLTCAPADGEVFQCVDEGGRILLTDSGCPPGYSINLVVGEPHPPEDELLAYREEAEERAAAADAARLAAEAETARLRAELEDRRWEEQAAQDRLGAPDQDRLDALDRKLDSLLERPQDRGGAGSRSSALRPGRPPMGGLPPAAGAIQGAGVPARRAPELRHVRLPARHHPCAVGPPEAPARPAGFYRPPRSSPRPGPSRPS
jgi:hypothetical protein